jgi:hypothetical protein
MNPTLLKALGVGAVGIPSMMGLDYMYESGRRKRKHYQNNLNDPGRGQRLYNETKNFDKLPKRLQEDLLANPNFNPYHHFDTVGGKPTSNYYIPPGTEEWVTRKGSSPFFGKAIGTALGLGTALATRGKIRNVSPWLTGPALTGAGTFAGHLFDKKFSRPDQTKRYFGYEKWQRDRILGKPQRLFADRPLYANQGMKYSENYPKEEVGRDAFLNTLAATGSTPESQRSLEKFYRSNPKALDTMARISGGYWRGKGKAPARYIDPNKTVSESVERLKDPAHVAKVQASNAERQRKSKEYWSPYGTI